jgi:replicative DNA helicase
MSIITEKVPPQSLDAEMAVLGAMLIEKEAISKALEIVNEEDFYKDLHKQTFNAIKDLFNRNLPVDILTLAERLKKSGIFEQAGGATYLTSLIDSVQTAANVEQYASIIRDKSVFRRLIKAGSEIVEDAFNEKDDPDKILDKSQKLIFDISQDKNRGDFSPVPKIINSLLDKLSALHEDKKDVTGVPTGFTDLDSLTLGLQPSELIIIAARPSMGKTSFALNIVEHVALAQKKPVAVFSLEMTKESLMMRILSSMSQVDAQLLRKGMFSGAQWSRITDEARRIYESSIYIDDSSDISAIEIRSRSRRLAARLYAENKDNPLAMIVVDYLQYIKGNGRYAESRQLEVAEISRSLKALAKDLNVPVVVLSQLSRDQAKRGTSGNSRPLLSDLRDSGAIEQDADVVMFIHYDKEEMRQSVSGTAQILVEKQRNGPTGDVNLTFERRFTRFYTASNRTE